MVEDPYQPPAAELTAGEATVTWPWRLFLGVNVVLLSLLLVIPGVFDQMNGFDAFDLVVSLVGLIGLAGLAFNRRIGPQRFWRGFFVVILVESIVYTIGLPLLGVDSYGESARWDFFKLFEILLASVAVYAIHVYAHRRESLWQR